MCQLRLLTTLLLGWGLCTACALGGQAYPPACCLPTRRSIWGNTILVPVTAPPDDLAYKPPARKLPRLVPTNEEWSLWEPAPTMVCCGKGKARKCTPTASPAVRQAQASALICPTRTQLGNGASSTITYDYQPGAIYLVEVAQHAGTHLNLPPGQRLRLAPVLNKEMFVVGTDDSPEDETHNDILALRAKQAPQRAVNVPLIFRSGLIITVRLVTVEGDPMTLVQWQLPEPKAPTTC